MNTELSNMVLARCDRDVLPPDHALRKLAKEFNDKTEIALREKNTADTRKMLGAWARLRKEWRAYSGEEMI